MECPRCGATAAPTAECPRCGVILAKARPPRAPRPSPRSAGGNVWRALALPGAGLALLVAAAAVHLRQPPSTPTPTPPARPRLEAPFDPGAGLPEAPPPVVSVSPPVAPVPEAALEGAGDPRDEEAAKRLLDRLRANAALSDADVDNAERLFERHGLPARSLLEAVLLRAADAHRSRHRPDRAVALAERAAAVAPDSPRAFLALLALRLEAGDWPGAEAAGRRALALAPADLAAARGLAYALLRQDRPSEAEALLREVPGVTADPEARALLERLARGRGAEGRLDEARLSHFHVRYDGEEHEAVGREVLRILERHHATLALAFDHQPAGPIPVVLLSRERYDDATGAPFWSGGQYDSFDGRVRVPIGGLTPSLTPELEGTLLHELTHAFVAEMSRGHAPREIHEGIAQWMEGRRTESLDPGTLQALADGRLGGVGGFYLSALSFVEDLAAQRGQGGINDLLREMGRTGSSNRAFRSVYGSDLASLRAAWASRLRQRHGS